MKNHYHQLTFAREFRGLTQSELSNAIPGLKQSNLSKFEKGFDVLSDNVLQSIFNYLGFPYEFYNKRIGNVIENAHYRKRTTIRMKEIKDFECKVRLLGYIIDEMADYLEFPDNNLFYVDDMNGFSPEKIAIYYRKLLNLKPYEPIQNIITLLESKGILIYEIDAQEKFDGVSFFTDKGYPIIVLNKNLPNDRKRFTIAHELGHIIMHNGNKLIPDFRDKEKEANEFAGEFLMPASIIKNELRGLKLKDLAELKMRWLTSMSSIIYRANFLGCIDSTKNTNLKIEMSRLGYTKHEPVTVPIDTPLVIKEAYKIMREDFDKEDLVKYFALPYDVLQLLLPERNVKVISMYNVN